MARLRLTFALIFFAALCIPLALRWTKVLHELPLMGVEDPPAVAPFTLAGFLAGKWQKGFEAEFTHELGLRPTLVRTDNQISLTVFGELKPPRILGKRDFIFDKGYHPQVGWHFGQAIELAPLVQRLRSLKEALGKLGIVLLVEFSPNKSRFLPDVVPEVWRPYLEASERPERGDLLRQGLTALQVPVADFHLRFEQLRGTAKAPLFTQGGVHWSHYGAALAGKELLAYLGVLCGKPFPILHVDEVVSVPEPLGTDRDLADLANVWSRKRFWGNPVEPVVRVEMPDAATNPRVLFVGTSFVWNLTDLFLAHRICSELEFWYYANTRVRFPGAGPGVPDERSPIDLAKLDFRAELQRFDAVVLEVCIAFADQVGFGFIEAALAGLGAK